MLICSFILVCNAHLNIFTWNLRDINVYNLFIGGASVVQWLVRWTLGRRARVQVLPGACRCILKQDALPTLLRLSDKT